MTTPETPIGPEDVPRPPKAAPITPGEERMAPQTERPFSTYMKGAQPNPLIEGRKSPQITPFDLAHGQIPTAGPTFSTIQEQAKMAQTSLGDIANQLKTSKLKLKQSTKYLLKNKLGSAMGHLRSANNKLGGKEVPEEKAGAGAGILQKFLGVVTHGQNLLNESQKQLSELSLSGKEFNPAQMLAIQVKLSKATQELSYTSILLSKAVDDLKMMMNIQL